jgi:DNA mismatch repair protein MutS
MEDLPSSSSYTDTMHDGSKQTPMMKQYWRFKAEASDAILLFHLGDFYETFFEDAETVARELDIVLTSRNGHPMAGVPIRRGEAYIQQLLQRGHKVAVCQQVEDPKQAQGLVKREIVRVITPGTVLDDGLLEAASNNYLCALEGTDPDGPFGVAFLDLSTGEFSCTIARTSDELHDELTRRAPSEILLSRDADRLETLLDDHFVTHIPAEEFRPSSDRPFALGEDAPALRAAGAILAYIERTQRCVLSHIRQPTLYSLSDQMDLDAFTVSSLELVRPLREGTHRGTLLHALDATSTAMGRRRLRRRILSPLTARARIEDRLDAVDLLVHNVIVRQQLRSCVREVHDIERLLGKLGASRMRPSDLQTLLDSLGRIPPIVRLLSDADASGRLATIQETLDKREISELCSAYAGMLVDPPPADARDGGLIQPHYNAELDALRSEVRTVRSHLAALEAREREATGIPSLKVGHNRVFGYYLEVTQTHQEKVPEHYQRRQTLANAERYVTEELQAFEERIASAEEQAKALELALFEETLTDLTTHMSALQDQADALSELDVTLSLAEVAHLHNYVRPRFSGGQQLSIRAGRHPVVERLEEFVPNDIHLGSDTPLIVLTGPNMAGKSVYLRQTALIALMAQIGSFVPAEVATLPLVDRVFARVGASDMLVSGISTFMMEMLEVSTILRRATSHSLIILDEMGRGTSTYDGVSIAWAVARDLATRVRANTLFATHYQELTSLADEVPGVQNLHVAVKEVGREVVFLHRVEKGVARGSYGVHVARLAGLPDHVTEAAEQMLKQLLQETPLSPLSSASAPRAQPIPLFGAEDHPIIQRLRTIDPNALTPMQALQLLDEIHRKIREFEA